MLHGHRCLPNGRADAPRPDPAAALARALLPLMAKGVTGMDSSATARGQRPFWFFLGGIGAFFALLGIVAWLWTPPPPRRETWWQRARRGAFAKDVQRAGRATARGVGSGLGAAWDVVVGGADAVRTHANVMPVIVSAVNEARSSLASALGRTGSATTSFVAGTVRTLLWLSLVGAVLMFIYMPEASQRQRFFERTRRLYNWLRSLFGYGR